MNSALDSIILDMLCRDPKGTRGNRLLDLMHDKKKWNEFLRETKITTIEELVKWATQPMKRV